MPKFKKVNGSLIRVNQEINKKNEFLKGHTYIPVDNKDDDLNQCIVHWIDSDNDKEVINKYKHSKMCSACRTERNKKWNVKFVELWIQREKLW